MLLDIPGNYGPDKYRIPRLIKLRLETFVGNVHTVRRVWVELTELGFLSKRLDTQVVRITNTPVSAMVPFFHCHAILLPRGVSSIGAIWTRPLPDQVCTHLAAVCDGPLGFAYI